MKSNGTNIKIGVLRRRFKRDIWLFSFDIKNYRIGILRGKAVLRIIKSHKNGRNITDRSLNPVIWVKRRYHNISWKLTEFYLSLIKEGWRSCQGCGEGIIKYKNVDPNDRRKFLFCCEGCYNFYGWNGTISEINDKDWKLIKEKYYFYKVRNEVSELRGELKTKTSIYSLNVRLNEQVPLKEIEKALKKLEKQGKIIECDKNDY